MRQSMAFRGANKGDTCVFQQISLYRHCAQALPSFNAIPVFGVIQFVEFIRHRAGIPFRVQEEIVYFQYSTDGCD